MTAVLGIVAAASIIAAVSAAQGPAAGQDRKEYEVDTFATKTGELKITFIGHGTLMFGHSGKIVHVDPVSREADYSKLPKGDLVLITHEHGDHLDPMALNLVRGDNTKVVLTETCAKQVQGGIVMKNGDVQTVQGLKIEAVPAYNIEHKRGGQPFHPKGVGNGYIVTFGETRVYVAGGDQEGVAGGAVSSGLTAASPAACTLSGPASEAVGPVSAVPPAS